MSSMNDGVRTFGIYAGYNYLEMIAGGGHRLPSETGIRRVNPDDLKPAKPSSLVFENEPREDGNYYELVGAFRPKSEISASWLTRADGRVFLVIDKRIHSAEDVMKGEAAEFVEELWREGD